MANLNKSSRIKFLKLGAWLWLIALVMMPLPVSAQALTRVANTSLTFPPQPPRFGYNLVDAFPPDVSFFYPVAVVAPPGETNRLFVAEQGGMIYVITNLANPTKTLFMDISARVQGTAANPSGEQGFQSLAFHPDFASNGYFYVIYCSQENLPQGNGFYNRVSRFQVIPGNPNQGDPTSELPILVQTDQNFAHNINTLRFGPDGYLYISAGDEGVSADQWNNAQRVDKNFYSGMLRIDVDKRPGNLLPNPHPASTTNYLVPADNPFIGLTNFNGIPVNPAAVRTEFFAVGLRNPFQFTFDPITGNILTGDVGESAYEEINVVVKGGNYGWSFLEGTHPGPKAGTTPPGFTSIPPLIEYPHGTGPYEGNAAIGGIFYQGTRLSQLYGSYLFADYRSGNVWKLRLTGTNTYSEFERIVGGEVGIVGFCADPSNGDVLLCNISSGRIRRLNYDETPTGTPLPLTLADTGAFSDLQTLQPASGVVPYALNLPFWSDNAIKTRWFSLPNTNLSFGFTPEGNWSFPTGSVWVKHFEMEMTNGVPSSRRRLETRFMIRNGSGVYGLTYRWDAAQTNATLVPEAGEEENLLIDNGAGQVRTQRWVYPSRSLCLSCHSPAGGYALGFSTRQLNRDFNYGSGPTNQILALSEAGYFQIPVTNLNGLGLLAHYTNSAHSLEFRFRSYLQANCVYCHQPGGTGRGHWDGRITTPMANADLINGLLAENLGSYSNRVIRPGSPGQSVMLYRISHNDEFRMPPVGSSVLDTNAMALLRDYIRSLVKVMPLGDELTAGDSSPNSYRSHLWQLSTNAGLTIDLVGSLTQHTGGGLPDPGFDADHEGSAAAKAEDVLATINSTASNSHPAFVLLLLGGNDLIAGQTPATTATEIGQIIDQLRNVNSNVCVLLGLNPPMTAAWTGYDQIPALNSSLVALAAAKSSAGSPVITVDHFSGFDPATETIDGRRPNAVGAAHLAANWFNGLSQALALSGNLSPSITLTQPADGDAFVVPPSIALQATAGDSDGVVSSVQFFVNGNLVTTSTNAPYQGSWTNPPLGTHTIHAVVTDNVGVATTSMVANVTISSVPPYARGVNLNGDSVFVEGRTWLGFADALSQGLSVTAASLGNGLPSTLVPEPDLPTRQMLGTGIYRPNPPAGEGFTLSQTLSNGAYSVWIWSLENFQSGFRDMDIRIEGSVAATNVGDLPFGHWEKLGPYLTVVTDGVLDIDVVRATKGDPMISGFLITAAVAPSNNTPPFLSGFSDQVLPENTSSAPLPFTIGDADQGPSQLILSAQSSATSVVAVSGIVFGGSGSNRTVTITPAPNGFGTSVVSIVVSDPYLLRATNSFLVSVLPVNDPPIVSLQSPVNGQFFGAPANIPVSVTAADPEGALSSVQLFWNGTLARTFTNPPFSFVVTNAALGEHQFVAVASDATGLQATSAVVVATVGQTPPYFRGINVGAGPVTIEGRSWLGYADALSQGLSVTDANVNNSAHGLMLVPGADVDTRQMLQGRLYCPNPPLGQGINLAQAITNGDYEVFLWTMEDFQNNYRNMNVLLEGVQVATNIGDLPVGHWVRYGPYPVTVSDGVLNLSLVKSTKGDPLLCGVAIRTLVPVSNTPPVITAIANQTINEDSTTALLPFTVSDEQTAPSLLTVSGWSANPSLIPANAFTFGGSASNRTVRITPAANAFGTTDVGVIVVDQHGGQATNSFQLTVLPMNDAPAVSLISPQNNSAYIPPADVTIEVAALDVDGQVVEVSVFSGMQLLGTLTNAPYTLTWSNAPLGIHGLRAVATDDSGTTSTSAVVSVSVTTSPPFSRGINLSWSGNEVTIEGRLWWSFSQALAHGLTTANANSGSVTGISLSPEPDLETKHMLETVVYRGNPPNGEGFTLNQTLSNGTYEVWVWAVENFQSNFRRSGLRIEGVTVTTNIGDLPLGGWAKYGPYPASVSDGVLNLEVFRSGKGDPLLCGVLIVSTTPVNLPPAVNLLLPTTNAILPLTASVGLVATAIDLDGTVAGVEFFDNGQSLGIVPGTNLGFTWTNPSQGFHQIQAVATDNLGAASTSAPVQVRIARTPLLNVTPFGTGLRLDLQGESNSTYRIDATTNMFDWHPLITNETADGFIQWFHTNVPDGGRQFYRAVQLQ